MHFNDSTSPPREQQHDKDRVYPATVRRLYAGRAASCEKSTTTVGCRRELFREGCGRLNPLEVATSAWIRCASRNGKKNRRKERRKYRGWRIEDRGGLAHGPEKPFFLFVPLSSIFYLRSSSSSPSAQSTPVDLHYSDDAICARGAGPPISHAAERQRRSTRRRRSTCTASNNLTPLPRARNRAISTRDRQSNPRCFRRRRSPASKGLGRSRVRSGWGR